VIPCDAFSHLGLSVPPGNPAIPDEGLLTFSWLDDSADGFVGAGGSFEMAFDYCLDVEDPSEDSHDMYNGDVGLNSLTEVVTDRANSSFITRIGWEGPGVAGRPGGIEFNSLTLFDVYDADDDGPGTRGRG
jgi:hypothetical protein